MPVRGFDTVVLSIELRTAIAQIFEAGANQAPGWAEEKAPAI